MSKHEKKPLPAELDPDEDLTADPPEASPAPPAEQDPDEASTADPPEASPAPPDEEPPSGPEGYGSGV